MNTDQLCMGCMREIGHEKQCPHCGFQSDAAQVAPYLPIRTVVGERYVIGKLLEYNGEGATYIAYDTASGNAVCLREFYPLGLVHRAADNISVVPISGYETAYRECGRSFADLWNKLCRMRDVPGIIRAFDLISDYGTIYAIMENNNDDITLREYLLGSRTGYISWDKARQLLMPVLSAIDALHSNGIYHRGISPLTLLIGRDGKIRISGFCTPQVRSARSDLEPQLYPGYAAIEQYGYKGQQGPWTDIYAFGAVLYRTLIGSDPIEATTRVTNDRLMVPGKFAEQLPAYVINGLVNSLQILPEDRTQSAEQLHAEITASPSAAVAEESFVESRRVPTPAERPQRQPSPVPAPKKKKKKKQSGSVTTALTAALICVVVGLAGFLVLSATVLPEEYNVFRSMRSENTSEVNPDNAEMVVMPDFRTKNYTEIISSDYYKSRFTIEKEDVNSQDVEFGYIISQSVEPGTKVPAGTKVLLTVSKGIEKVRLTNVLGMNYDEAYALLTDIGFEVSKAERANDGTHTAGEVIQMSKTPEAMYEKGEKVTLQVYAEPLTEEAPTTTTTAATTQPAPTTPPETDVETVPYPAADN